jgi:esterase/lipase
LSTPIYIKVRENSLKVKIAKLTIPVLIIQGTTDIQVSATQADLLADANTKAKKEMIENMNHVLKDCDSMDMQAQMPTYNNLTIPLNKKIGKVITDFIKGE